MIAGLQVISEDSVETVAVAEIQASHARHPGRSVVAVASASLGVSQVGDRCIVRWLVSGPSAGLGVAGFDLSKLAKELAWSAAAEGGEKAIPVGDTEGLDETGGSIGEHCCSSNIGELYRLNNGVLGSFGL